MSAAPRRTPPRAEPLALFDLPRPSTRPAVTKRCMWHLPPEPDQECTHRLIIAVDLMHPRWWRNGGLRPDGGLRACDGGQVRLFTVGTAVCDACAEPNPEEAHRWGMVEHFVPLGEGA